MDQGFPNRYKGLGPWEIFSFMGFFLLGCGNLRRGDFNKSNLFQSQKHHSVNIER